MKREGYINSGCYGFFGHRDKGNTVCPGDPLYALWGDWENWHRECWILHPLYPSASVGPWFIAHETVRVLFENYLIINDSFEIWKFILLRYREQIVLLGYLWQLNSKLHYFSIFDDRLDFLKFNFSSEFKPSNSGQENSKMAWNIWYTSVDPENIILWNKIAP